MGIPPWEKAKLYEFGKNRFAMEKAIRATGVAMRTVGDHADGWGSNGIAAYLTDFCYGSYGRDGRDGKWERWEMGEMGNGNEL